MIQNSFRQPFTILFRCIQRERPSLRLTNRKQSEKFAKNKIKNERSREQEEEEMVCMQRENCAKKERASEARVKSNTQFSLVIVSHGIFLCIFSQSVRLVYVFFSSFYLFFSFVWISFSYLFARSYWVCACASLFMVVRFSGFMSSSIPLALSPSLTSSFRTFFLCVNAVDWLRCEEWSSILVISLSTGPVRLGDYVIVRP